MVTPMYHLHLDAARLPGPLLDRLIHEGGFHFDDFPHELVVDGEARPARHLTKYLYAPTNSHEAKAECLKLKAWAHEYAFQGLIQCEYVMEETEWKKQAERTLQIPTPFVVTSRPLTSIKGDQFKKHEVHLELNKFMSATNVVDALRGTGLHILENDTTITFTISGHSKEMLALRDALKSFLAEHTAEFTGKLTYEATAFWSLHDVESQTLPTIVDQIIF
jgi:hypothetical protein